MFKSIIFVVLAFIISCDQFKPAQGRNDRIVVFGDEVLWQSMRDTLHETIAAPWNVPGRELKYILAYKKFEDFGLYKNQKNLLFIVAENQKNVLNKLADQIIPATFKPYIENETYNFFLFKNVYAKDQLVMMIVLKNHNTAADIFGSQFKKLETFRKFEEAIQERLLSETFRYQEDDDAHNLMIENHGYSIRTPYRFHMIDNNVNKDSNLVSIFQHYPIQWAITRKLHNVESDQLDVDFLMDHRDIIMNHYFEGDSVDRDGLVISDIEVDSLKGIRVQGGYLHYDDGILTSGGPFITYGLYDEELKLVYFLDAQVFDLGKRKSADLMKMESILKTFKKVRPNKSKFTQLAKSR